MNKTGLVWHELYMWHDTGNYAGLMPPSTTVQPNIHYESPEPKRRIKNLLDATGLSEQLTLLKPQEASHEQLAAVHTESYLQAVDAHLLSQQQMIDGCTVVGNSSPDIAKLAAGGAVAAVDAVMRGTVDNAYALIRPPGHHAESERAMGFCIYANAAVAAAHAVNHWGLSRVAIVDWDVHHGNGSEEIFYERSDVLTISLHQDGLFPANSGAVTDAGTQAGVGRNINIPLPAGCGEGAYVYAFDEIVLPALAAYAPELIIIACGFDASIEDPLGRMMLHADSYRTLTDKLMTAASANTNTGANSSADANTNAGAKGRIVVTHEGGYNPNTTPYLGLAVIETLLGHSVGVVEAPLADFKATPGQRLQPHQQLWIDELKKGLQAQDNTLL